MHAQEREGRRGRQRERQTGREIGTLHIRGFSKGHEKYVVLKNYTWVSNFLPGRNLLIHFLRTL